MAEMFEMSKEGRTEPTVVEISIPASENAQNQYMAKGGNKKKTQKSSISKNGSAGVSSIRRPSMPTQS